MELGMGVLNGDFEPGDGGDAGTKKPNDDPNAYGQGVINIQDTDSPFQEGSAGTARKGIKQSYVNVLKIYMANNRKRKLNNRLSKFDEYKNIYNSRGNIVPLKKMLVPMENVADIIGSASIAVSSSSRLYTRIVGADVNSASFTNLSDASRIFSTKIYLPRSPFNYSKSNWYDCEYLPTTIELLQNASQSWGNLLPLSQVESEFDEYTLDDVLKVRNC